MFNKKKKVEMTTYEREVYLRTKLNSLCTEYLALEKEKECYYYKQYRRRDLSRNTIDTLHIMQNHIDGVVRRIVNVVTAMRDNDFDIDNEVAHLVYNYYFE